MDHQNEKPFNNPNLFGQGWYYICPSRDIKKGRVYSFERFGKKLAVYRDSQGAVTVLHGKCAHLGADLSRGQLIGDRLECPFHGWQYDRSGAVVRIPQKLQKKVSRCVFAFPVTEQFKAIFIFNGPEPLFPIPDFPDGGPQQQVIKILKGEVINVHPHIATVNGFDISHFRFVHGLDLDDSQQVEVLNEHQMRITWKLPLNKPGWLNRFLKLIIGQPFVDMEFVSIGGNQSYARHVSKRWSIMILFNNYEIGDGRSMTTTIIIGKKGKGLWKWIGGNLLMIGYLHFAMNYILDQDRKGIFDHLDFQPKFTDADEALVKFRQLVNQLPTFEVPE